MVTNKLERQKMGKIFERHFTKEEIPNPLMFYRDVQLHS